MSPYEVQYTRHYTGVEPLPLYAHALPYLAHEFQIPYAPAAPRSVLVGPTHVYTKRFLVAAWNMSTRADELGLNYSYVRPGALTLSMRGLWAEFCVTSQHLPGGGGGGSDTPHPPPIRPPPLLIDWANFSPGLQPINIFLWRLQRKSFRPKNFFGAFGASNNSGFPGGEGGGPTPQPLDPPTHPQPPPLSKTLLVGRRSERCCACVHGSAVQQEWAVDAWHPRLEKLRGSEMLVRLSRLQPSFRHFRGPAVHVVSRARPS